MQKFRTNSISMQDILFFHRKISGRLKEKIEKEGRFWVGFESIVKFLFVRRKENYYLYTRFAFPKVDTSNPFNMRG